MLEAAEAEARAAAEVAAALQLQAAQERQEWRRRVGAELAAKARGLDKQGLKDAATHAAAESEDRAAAEAAKGAAAPDWLRELMGIIAAMR